MLGEMIAEDKGKITGIRVLPSEGPNPECEVSFQATGRMFGIDITDIGTYQSHVEDGGVMHGKGQGMLMTTDGEAIAWTGEGVGKPGGKGMAASWRGSLYYHTASQKLAKLNGLCAVFEHEVDEAGNLTTKIFEWK